MSKFSKIFQVAYIAFAVLFLYRAYVEWNVDRMMSYLLLGAAFMAIFKFFFNRKYRKRFDNYYQNKEKDAE